ncbi:Gluconate 5-dehydrogenase [Andreprevotia sp. IGB-42]|uniref:SDR family oxidoreductase n=1 Tax=Andreprevotia sp. IGB-42 TaxID=2497473 RepID=UPI00135A659E|nr:SDR family oxidoreductase [Andreprevotia sp. IGB-42]KAF0815465.1 Gluconate 5-dehydrogenase [Andreprevotia sp. IGB-42]
MHLGLQGKNVLITGGSKGIGLACARLFVAEGARVALVGRSAASLDAASSALGAAYTVAADLRDADAAASMVIQMEAQFGPIDILVNSAGAAQRTNAEALSPQAWREAMDAKYFSYINVIDPVIKLMAERGRGCIVNIIGKGGKIPTPTHIAGGAANAALMLATAGLGHAYAVHGVRVLGVSPGTTHTERVTANVRAQADRAGISVEEAYARMVEDLPLGRPAEPEEIADIVVFAASERSRYLTGTTITVDGAASPTVV